MSCSENCTRIFTVCCAIPCTILGLILGTLICIGIALVPIMVFYTNVLQLIFNGAEWQNKSISNLSMLESVAVSPFECPKVDVYFLIFPPCFWRLRHRKTQQSILPFKMRILQIPKPLTYAMHRRIRHVVFLLGVTMKYLHS